MPRKRKSKDQRLKFPPKKIHLTPQEKVAANYMFLQGCDAEAIAAKFDLNAKQVHTLIRDHFRPAWQEAMKGDAERELAKIDNLERTAWAVIYGDEEGASPNLSAMFGQIRWCIGMRAKLHRNYEQQFREADSELRVAGAVNREQVEREMAIKLLTIANAAVRERKEQLEAEKAAKRKPRKSRKKTPDGDVDAGPVGTD